MLLPAILVAVFEHMSKLGTQNMRHADPKADLMNRIFQYLKCILDRVLSYDHRLEEYVLIANAGTLNLKEVTKERVIINPIFGNLPCIE
jgi:hypothetical protein